MLDLLRDRLTSKYSTTPSPVRVFVEFGPIASYFELCCVAILQHEIFITAIGNERIRY